MVSGITLKIERNAIGEFERLPFNGIPKNFNVYLKKAAIQVTIERTKFVQMTNASGGVTKDVTKDNAKQLSDRQRIILRLIEGDAFVTTNEMSQKTGVTTRTIKRDLEYLQEHGILIREGGRKEGRWIILIE